MKAFCFRCKLTREMKDPQPIKMANTREGTVGVCPVCGGKLFLPCNATKQGRKAAEGQSRGTTSGNKQARAR